MKREIEPLLARNRVKATANPIDSKAGIKDSRPNSEERLVDMGLTGGPEMQDEF